MAVRQLGGIWVRLVVVVALVAGATALLPGAAGAATFTVTANRITGVAATDDPGGPFSCDPADCSLREAVLAANASPGADVITFEVAGTVALGLDGMEAGAGANDLDVAEPLTLTAHDGGTTIDASGLPLSPDSRALEVVSTVLELRGITVTGATASVDGGAVLVSDGELVLVDAVFDGNASGGSGGAVFLSSSDLTATGGRFEGNRTAFDGGAIGTDDYGQIAITGTTFTGNLTGQLVGGQEFAGGDGGAIAAQGAGEDSTMTIAGSEFRGNVAIDPQVARGGAISTGTGTAAISSSWFEDNGWDMTRTRTDVGGAIASDGGTVELRTSSVVANRASERGGGLALEGDGLVARSHVGANQVPGVPGGGVYVANGTVSIVNTTIESNESTTPVAVTTQGAGLHVASAGTAELTHVTLAANIGEVGMFVDAGAAAQLRSSILAGHPTNCGGPGAPTSGDFNLEDADTCGLAQPDDLVDTPPGLAAAADNGGDPQGVTPGQTGATMALAATSPAVDTSDPALCGVAPVDVDQRGVSRAQGPACDRGAFELFVEPPPTPTPTPTPTPMEPVCDESAPGATDPPIGPGLNRIEGLNRIQTAIVASQAICGDGQAPAVVLTRADLFPDAQAGTPLAVQLGAPLLLSQPEGLSPDTEEEILRVLEEGRTVYLLGGVVALADAVEQRLDSLGFDTVRYGGVNRFETAQVIAEDGLGSPDTILLTNGGDFADSVVAGAAAATFRDGGDVAAAVLLTSGTDRSPFTEAHLAGRTDDPELIAVGAAAATAYPAAEDVSGPTRFETAVAVADRFYTDPVAVGIARHDEFADALTGGAIVGRPDIGPGPVLLTASTDLPPVVDGWLRDHAASIERAVIFGGVAAVSADVEAAVAAALAP